MDLESANHLEEVRGCAKKYLTQGATGLILQNQLIILNDLAEIGKAVQLLLNDRNGVRDEAAAQARAQGSMP